MILAFAVQFVFQNCASPPERLDARDGVDHRRGMESTAVGDKLYKVKVGGGGGGGGGDGVPTSRYVDVIVVIVVVVSDVRRGRRTVAGAGGGGTLTSQLVEMLFPPLLLDAVKQRAVRLRLGAKHKHVDVVKFKLNENSQNSRSHSLFSYIGE